MLKKLFMKRLGKNQKGVTLIELMAVVVILGIIAGVAGAAVTGAFSSAKTNADKTSEQVLYDAAQRYVFDMATVPTAAGEIAVADLQSNGYITNVPEVQAESNKVFKVSYTISTGGKVVVAVSKVNKP